MRKGTGMSVSASLGQETVLDLPQGTISYRERGSGQPLLLLGGLLVNGDTFRDILAILSRRFRCITPDLPLGAHRHPMPRGADRLGNPSGRPE
jgi:pimeloyl-ACP methyl ester carboxylesterase